MSVLTCAAAETKKKTAQIQAHACAHLGHRRAHTCKTCHLKPMVPMLCRPTKKMRPSAHQAPLLLCPRGSCLEPSNANPGSLGSLSSFFVCWDSTDGSSTEASTWLPATGLAALAGFAAAGFHSNQCELQRGSPETDCAICSWVLPGALPTRALADRCALCNGVNTA